jgi:hypothetical protein
MQLADDLRWLQSYADPLGLECRGSSMSQLYAAGGYMSGMVYVDTVCT